MTHYLVRHARAGHRSRWTEDDDLRPLDREGRRQAKGLAAALGHLDIARVLSSPAVRCIETVEPLAVKLGDRVEPLPELAEGADPTGAIRLLEQHPREQLVLCSHGDVIPEVVDLLRRRGMTVEATGPNKKGSWWAIEVDGDRFTTARYHPPA